MDITTRIKMVWTTVAPYVTSLSGMGAKVLGLAWSALLVSFKPFWVPAVTLARNPLTAIVVGVMLIGSYLAGNEVRALRDHAAVTQLIHRHDAELKERDAALKANTAMLLKEKATLVEELDAAKKVNDALEAKLKLKSASSVPAKAPSKVKAAAAPKLLGLF